MADDTTKQAQQEEFLNVQPLTDPNAVQKPAAPATTPTVQPTSATPSTSEEFQTVTPLPKPAPPAATAPEPKKSWGTRAVEAIGNMVPEGAPAAAQKAENAIGSLVPDWAVPAMYGFQKYVNEPLDRAAAAGTEGGRNLAREAVTLGHQIPNAYGEINRLMPNNLYGPRPSMPDPEAETAAAHPIQMGVAETVGGMAGGLIADPRNWPLLGSGEARPLIQKALSGGFGIALTKDAADTLTDAAANWDKLTPEQRTEALTKAGISAGVGALSTAHTFHGTDIHPLRTAKEIAQRVPEIVKGEEGANIGHKVGSDQGVVKGKEQFNSENLPRQYGAKKAAGPQPIKMGEYREETPAAPETNLVGNEYAEPQAPRATAKPFQRVEPGEYREVTPAPKAEGLVSGPEQFSPRNLPGMTGAEPVVNAKSTGPKTPYGNAMDFEPAEEKPITKEEVKSSPGTSMAEEQRKGAERRQDTTTGAPNSAERRIGDRRIKKDAEGNPAMSPDVESLWQESAFGKKPESDIGTKVREKNPEPTREEVAAGANVLKHITDGKKYAVVTAENPQNTRLTPEENAKLNEQLKQDLKDKGYKPVEVEGHTKDVEGNKEHSFFVPDIDPKDAAELGRKYKQQGILTSEGLHDLNTDKVNPVKPGEKLMVDDEARKQPYYSTTVVGNKAFSVPVDFEKSVEPGAKPEAVKAPTEEAKHTPEQDMNKRIATHIANTDAAREKIKDAEAEKLKQVAKPERDTDLLAQVKKDMPNATLSQQLMEAAKRAKESESVAPGVDTKEHDSRVETHVGDLSNANLKELGKAVGLNPDEYDFKKRTRMREGGSTHPVERQKMVKDIMSKLTPQQIEELGQQSERTESAVVGGEPARSSKSRSEIAEKLLKHLWENPEEGGGSAAVGANTTPEPKGPKPTDNKVNLDADHVKLRTTIDDNHIYYDKSTGKFIVEDKDGNQSLFDHGQDARDFASGQFEGKGPAPEATADNAKLSNEELLKKGYTQEDIDAGKHLLTAGGGSPKANTRLPGMKGVPEKITKHILTQEEQGLKTEVSQKAAAKKLKKMPSVQEFIDIANIGAGERKWYQRGTAAVKVIAEELPKYFDKAGDQEKFLNVLASLSPRQAIAENFTEAIRVWKEYKDMVNSGEDPFEPLNKKGTTRLEKMMMDTIGMNRSAKIPNAMMAFEGKTALEMWPDLSKNRYFKVPSFAANLSGFLDRVTSDGWMAAFADMKPSDLSDPSSYHPLAVMTRAAAEELGWEPAEAQAAIWAVVKTLTEKGETEPKEIRRYSQDFADIAQSDVQIREMLKDMGVDLDKLDERLKGIEGKPEVSSRSTPSTEDSVRKLTERLEKQGREIPVPRSERYGGSLEFGNEDDTSFEPSKYGEGESKITDKLLKRYGTTDEPYTSAQFITGEGERIPVQDHDQAVAKALGHEDKIDPDDRVNYINDENVIRMRTRSGRSASKEVVFSMPSSEPTPEQVKAIKETIKKMGPYGMAYMEEAKHGGDHVTMTNAKPEDVDHSIKQLYKPKAKWSSGIRAFHQGGEEE